MFFVLLGVASSKRCGAVSGSCCFAEEKVTFFQRGYSEELRKMIRKMNPRIDYKKLELSTTLSGKPKIRMLFSLQMNELTKCSIPPSSPKNLFHGKKNATFIRKTNWKKSSVSFGIKKRSSKKGAKKHGFVTNRS